MGEIAAAPPAPTTRSYRWLAAPLLAFAVVSLTAGLLAKHEPRSKGYFQLFFSDTLHMKAAFATAVIVLACVQLFTAAWIFRKLPWSKPAWVNPLHRWSGRLAFAHSLLGCFVYGAFAAKVTIVRLHRFPRLVLPLAGGALFAVLVGVWYTSAIWLYGQNTSAPAPPPNRAVVIPGDADPVKGKA